MNWNYKLLSKFLPARLYIQTEMQCQDHLQDTTHFSYGTAEKTLVFIFTEDWFELDDTPHYELKADNGVRPWTFWRAGIKSQDPRKRDTASQRNTEGQRDKDTRRKGRSAFHISHFSFKLHTHFQLTKNKAILCWVCLTEDKHLLHLSIKTVA